MDQKESNSIFRGSASDLSRHNQDGRSQQPPPPPPQQPPQKCPRCDSLNTKFCYYNNYSLTQPRYFCKTCRRYWTQGGTLRNVPVGGGCRKGSKRAKTASATASSSTSASSGGGGEAAPPVASMSSGSPYFPAGGGFLSSLAAIQSLSQNLGGGDAGFLQGFGMLPPFASQIQAQQLFQMGGGVDDGISKSLSLDNSSSILHHHHHHHQAMTGPPATSTTAVPRNNDWISQGMILSNPSSTAIPTPVDHSAAGLWGVGTGASAAAASNPAGDEDNSARDGSSSSRWPNIPGYGRQL